MEALGYSKRKCPKAGASLVSSRDQASESGTQEEIDVARLQSNDLGRGTQGEIRVESSAKTCSAWQALVRSLDFILNVTGGFQQKGDII